MTLPAKPDPELLAAARAELHRALAGAKRRPLVFGMCGAQGSGKSTLAAALQDECMRDGLTAQVLSLDDLYLERAARARLAGAVHPLLATRGVPGTHDTQLGQRIFDALDRGIAVRLPRFDKSRDEPAPVAQWPLVEPPLDVLLFEGWCVGAIAQSPDQLAAPVNDIEAREDPDGSWRRYVNAQLAGPYATLFARMDRLFLLAAPGFEVVSGWRAEQERSLAASRPEGGAIMSAREIDRFVRHYERLTRHILAEMPARADCTAWLRADRSVQALTRGFSG